MTLSLKTLIERKEALERQIREAQSSGKAAAISEVRKLMAEHGLTAADLVASTKTRVGVPAGTKVAAKYRDPATGQSWTGRGLKPKWLSAAIAGGRKLDDFAV